MSEETLFHLALEKPAVERAAFLDEACGGDAALRQRLEALLQAHEHPETFPAWPPGDHATTGPTPAADPPPAAVIGPYKLLQQIGEGGMGAVFMAEQTRPIQRRVALKLIKPGMDSRQVLARFEAERQALALMDHPNIARVLDAGETLPAYAGGSPRPYFVMELVKGVPITRYCDEHRLTPRQRLELFVDVCQAVQHAHQKGIIHRDLKPSNVLVALYDGRPVPKVIDFGIAKAIGSKLTERTLFTEFGAVVGTLEYMSPEQTELNNLDIDTRNDVYSLGVLLYELLTGTTPLERERLKGTALLEALRLIREEEPPRPSTRLSTTEELPAIAANRGLEPGRLSGLVRGELDWIVMKALEKDRGRRYDTAKGLGRDIERYLADEPVLACPPSAGYRLRKLLLRHRGPALAAALVLTALLAGVVVSSLLAVEARSAKAKAVTERNEKDQALARETNSNIQLGKALNDLRVQKRQTDQALDQERLALYDYRIHLAERELGLSHVDKAEQLLDECPGTLRHWEWHYLKGQCHKDLLTLRGHLDVVNAVAVSPDGTRLATISPDSSVRLWDANTGQELYVLTLNQPRFAISVGRAFDKGIRSVAFTPDGRRVLTTVRGGCQVWDVTTGKGLPDLLAAPPSPPAQQSAGPPLALSPDGLRLVTALGAGGVAVWDLKAGKKELDLRGHQKTIWSVAFSPDGKRLVTAGEDPVVTVWDAVSGDRLLDLKVASLRPDDEFFCRADFSPDGARVVTAGSDRLVKVWDARTGTELRTLAGHTGPVRRAVFSPTGKEIASAGADRTVCLWDAATGRPLAVYRGHDSAALDVAFWPDGRRLASAGADRTVKVWDATSVPEYRAIRVAPPPPDRVMPFSPVNFANVWPCLAWSPDGKRLATDGGRVSPAGKMGDLLLWDTETLKPAPALREHSQPLTRLVYSSDGRYLASAGLDGTVVVWDVANGRKLHALRVTPLHGISFTPDGQRLLLTTRKSLAAYDAATGREVDRFPLPDWQNGGPVCSPDGRYVASIDDANNALKVWDATAGAEVCSIANSEHSMRGAVFSPDGQLLAAGCLEGTREKGEMTIKLWSARTGKALATLRGLTGAPTGLAWSPDGKRLVSANLDGSLKLWDTATGRELLSLPAGVGPPRAPAFSPDGTRLAAFCADGLVRIWDAAPR
jgi:WD40 repeat protein/serine/threonine protein kinase